MLLNTIPQDEIDASSPKEAEAGQVGVTEVVSLSVDEPGIP